MKLKLANNLVTYGENQLLSCLTVSHTHHDISRNWTFERSLSQTLVSLLFIEAWGTRVYCEPLTTRQWEGGWIFTLGLTPGLCRKGIFQPVCKNMFIPSMWELGPFLSESRLGNAVKKQLVCRQARLVNQENYNKQSTSIVGKTRLIDIYDKSLSSSSSYRAGSTDIPDPLSPLLPIVHRPR